MAKKKREITQTDIDLLRRRVVREDQEFERKLASLTDAQREELPLVLEELKQRDFYYSRIYSKRPKSDSMRRHYEQALLEQAVELILNPPKPTGEELIRLFICDMLTQLRIGATFKEVKAWASVHYPDIARHWK